MKVLDKIRDNKGTIRAAVYPRFSSDNQRDESIDAQLRAIKEYAKRNDIIIVAEYILQWVLRRTRFCRFFTQASTGEHRDVTLLQRYIIFEHRALQISRELMLSVRSCEYIRGVRRQPM